MDSSTRRASLGESPGNARASTAPLRSPAKPPVFPTHDRALGGKLDTSNMASYIPHEDFPSWFLGCEVERVVVERGDVVLRRGVDDWPDYVPWEVDFTHAGIGGERRQTVVDACPSVDGRCHVVDRVGVDDFLDAARAPGGGAVYRRCSRVDRPRSKKRRLRSGPKARSTGITALTRWRQ